MAHAPVPAAVPFLPVAEQISGEALLAWRRQQIEIGGRPADFDWLLDLAGGVGWAELQRLRLSPGRVVPLRLGRPGLEALWARHLRHHEPLQYLVGLCPWRDLEVLVAPGVLIPRQETELLIDLVLAGGASPGLWADLGTGSGCLAVALGRTFPAAAGLAVDLSAEALAQAAANLAHHGLRDRVALHHGSWWEPLRTWWGQVDLAVANPPYIPTAVLAGLEPLVRDHEPSLALDGGADGLAAIRAVVAGAPHALAPGGRVLIEHHHDQSEAVLKLLEQVGLREILPHHDLEGIARFASARRPEQGR
ncbi:MAG: peptide chain release factor N(5)-glutamine methyltransferase [Cyanobium sp.]